VNLAWLATGSGPKDRSGREDVPLLEGYLLLESVAVEPGDGVASDVAFSSAWVDGHGGAAQLGFASVPDDSMAPLLSSGAALVLERTSGPIYRDGIYALALDGRLLVRRLQRLPGGQLQASPESPAYHPFQFSPSDRSVTVVGRVIWAGQDL
jgi:phage repressor protein C with HTH and peptisase S24 domain